MTKKWNWFTQRALADPKTGQLVPVRVDLTFDLDAIAHELGKKALRNKSGKSKLGLGITAEAKRMS